MKVITKWLRHSAFPECFLAPTNWNIQWQRNFSPLLHFENDTTVMSEPEPNPEEARNSLLDYRMSGRGPSTHTSFPCLPRYLSRKLAQRIRNRTVRIWDSPMGRQLCKQWLMLWHKGIPSLCVSVFNESEMERMMYKRTPNKTWNYLKRFKNSIGYPHPPFIVILIEE